MAVVYCFIIGSANKLYCFIFGSANKCIGVCTWSREFNANDRLSGWAFSHPLCCFAPYRPLWHFLPLAPQIAPKGGNSVHFEHHGHWLAICVIFRISHSVKKLCEKVRPAWPCLSYWIRAKYVLFKWCISAKLQFEFVLTTRVLNEHEIDTICEWYAVLHVFLCKLECLYCTSVGRKGSGYRTARPPVYP